MDKAAQKHSKSQLKNKAQDLGMYLFLVLPAVLLLSFTIFYPVVKSAFTSFFNSSLLNLKVMTWNNFKHYKDIFADFFKGEFWHSFLLSNRFAFTVVILQLIISVIFAIILNENIRGKKVMRSILLMPWVIPTAVTALLWMWIYQPDYGVLNYILKVTGISTTPIRWLGSIDTALVSVMVVALWKQLPFMTIMFIAGMQTIPADYYEASSLDGATKLQNYYYITIPFLKNIIKSSTLVAIIENFKMFPLFWLMTQGGPINSTTTLSVLTYQTSFVSMDLGKGATIGVLWIIFLVLFSLAYNSLFKETQIY